jgi:hypothetical protein
MHSISRMFIFRRIAIFPTELISDRKPYRMFGIGVALRTGLASTRGDIGEAERQRTI